MQTIDPEESLDFWRDQRVALLEYIEAARKSDGGNERSRARLGALRAGITKIDAKIGQLQTSSARCAAVLVVDDDPDLVHLSCLFLRGAGIICLEAVGASNALSVWKEHHRDICLVFTDLQMPGLNGDELVERFLKDKPDLKAIFTSGTPWLSGIPLEEGVNFFAKPYRQQKLTARIRELLVVD
jgi:CheY-like chemotaxis protein